MQRTYPYTGGDGGSHHFDAVPSWLNDLLLEQTPGREMRNFRLAVRVAWVEARATKCADELARIERSVAGSSGVAAKVARTVMERLWMQAWPQTSAEEVGNG
jgi:hypothetical protein